MSQTARTRPPDSTADTWPADFTRRVLELFAWHDMRDSLFWNTSGTHAPITYFVICSDMFAWGSADCEELNPGNIDALEQAIADEKAATPEICDPHWACELFAARQRGMRLQGAAYPKDERLWPLFDACGPEREVGPGNPKPHPSQRKDAK